MKAENWKTETILGLILKVRAFSASVFWRPEEEKDFLNMGYLKVWVNLAEDLNIPRRGEDLLQTQKNFK